MKNVVNYFYNLFPENIYQKNKKFFFSVDNVMYVLMQYHGDLKRLEKNQYIVDKLDYYHIPYNQLIKNNMNSLLTYVSNIPYILIKNNIDKQDNIILSDITDFYNYTKGIINDKINLENLSYLWMDKVDYFEYQVSQFGIKYPIIRHSFNYFIGLAENAISILNTISKKEIAGTISHFRVSVTHKISDLYNPTNFLIDSKVRDISEYFKEKMFFYDVSDEFIYYLKYNYFNNDEIILLLARLLFPTYYFDICEKSMLENNENDLKIIISKVNAYENNLKQIYKHLKNNYQIPEISWLLA